MKINNIDIAHKVSVVVPVYNGEATIGDCLDSLMKVDYPIEFLEIIVVDNNSNDSTAKIINQYPVKYVFEKKRGRASARNAGIREATGDFIAFIDADCIAYVNWLKNLLRGFSDDSIAACGGEELERQPKTIFEKYFLLRFSFSQKRWLEHKEYVFPVLLTFNAIFRRKVFEDVGLFDEQFLTSEDVDLSLRLHQKGHVLKYVENACVDREYPTTFKAFCRKSFSSGFSYAFLYSKHKHEVRTPSVFQLVLVNLKDIISLAGHYIKNIFIARNDCAESMPLLGIVAEIQSSLGMVCGALLIRLSSMKNVMTEIS